MREAKLISEIKNMKIKDSGKTKEEVLGKIFASFRRKVQTETIGVIVKLEPIETYLINIEEEKITERFLELFMPREKTVYHIEMEIEYEIKYIKL
ncbi:DUF4312 family protein [Fusobacterium sp.]|uniref:DUF4312 family protein n=1 Tax=Fusobacterium sp. TaxID=68766 RepID=UPI002904CA75|nr:DUF4312 family protein [Fusobacterium sp.]MDU1909672.1 DUF4312 family protein [Fusobacterium sp.]